MAKKNETPLVSDARYGIYNAAGTLTNTISFLVRDGATVEGIERARAKYTKVTGVRFIEKAPGQSLPDTIEPYKS